MIRTIQCPSGETCYAEECVRNRCCMHMDEALLAIADPEYATRIDAQRVTLEFATGSTKRVDSGRECIEDSPIFGGSRQLDLFA